MATSKRSQFGLPTSKRNHVRKGRAAKVRRQESAKARETKRQNA